MKLLCLLILSNLDKFLVLLFGEKRSIVRVDVISQGLGELEHSFMETAMELIDFAKL